jgi:uncharacterized protein
MRTMKIALVCILLGVSFVVGQGTGVSVGAERIQLMMGTTSSSSSSYTMLVAAGKVVHDRYPEIFITAAESGAARDNCRRMARGEFDLGLIDSISAHVVMNGLEDFKGQANKELRWLWTGGQMPLMFFVRKAENIKSLYDLEGKKFNPAQAGSSAAQMVEGAFSVLGIKPQYYRGSYSDAVEAVLNKQIVGMAKTHGGGRSPDSAIMQVQASLATNFLSFSQEDMKKIKAQFPYFGAFWLEPNVYKDQPEKVFSIGFASGLATQSKLPEEVGYKIVKATIEGQDKVAESFQGLKGFDMVNVIPESATCPLHAGAARYYLERGLKIPPSMIPPEYKK